MKLLATKVRFKRKENSEWELGIGIGEDTASLDIIIDKESKPVITIWSYNSLYYEGIIWLELGE